MGHLLLWGNAFAQIIRDGRGRVVALYPLLPNKMTVNRTTKASFTINTKKMAKAICYAAMKFFIFPD
ncbi:Phage portal protein [Sporomusa ovata]|uniref:Phage portal protein n=1 Tax=Sporomusa ovata TaxID=2378 RepID=A0A0U1L5U8_9FIRM|nr:Phage portal protein [Sporomusa ovata]